MLTKRGEYYNSPALGTTRRHLVGSIQVNVTGVSGKPQESHTALGSAGEFHTDDGDDYCALSALTNLSDIGDDFVHGFFFLLEYGIAFQWTPLLTVLASGRALHVSSPPQLHSSSPGRAPEPWELRLLVISYPSLGVLTRTGPTLLTSNANGAFVLPARENDQDTPAVPTRPSRSWARDGGALMSSENHVLFLARELLNLGWQMFSQVPRIGDRTRIDPKTFLRSIQTARTSSSGDTEWIPAIPEPHIGWAYGPWDDASEGGSAAPAAPDFTDLKKRHMAGFILLSAKDKGTSPSQAAKAKVAKVKQSQGKQLAMSSCQRGIGKYLIPNSLSTY